ncbi:MAG: hypothetical protein J7L38_04180 [Thermoproteales archaeon]|nr:hypothetical protein [Thermoproteales archaeon]
MLLKEAWDILEKSNESYNTEHPSLWVKEKDFNGLSAVKGHVAFFVSFQDGRVEQIKGEGEGRDRIGFWYDFLRCIRRLNIGLYTNGGCIPLSKNAVKYVSGLGWKGHLYSINGVKIERIDYISLDKPILYIVFRIKGGEGRVLELVVEGETGFRYMWPWGEIPLEKYSIIEDDRKHVVFSSKQIHVATGFTDTSECKVSRKGNFSIISKAKEGEDLVLIVAAGRDLKEAEENFAYACKNWEEEFRLVTSYYEEMLSGTLTIETPDPRLNKVYLTSKYVLLLLFSHTSVGEGWFAGIPRFTWFFTGDGALLAHAANTIGLSDLSKKHLETMAAYSKENGQIPHELVLIPEVNSRGLYTGYMHVSATPLWILALWHTYLWSGDKGLLERNYERILKALEFLESLDTDGDGFIEVFPEKMLIAWDEITAGKRKGACMEVNALRILALKAVSLIAKVLGDEAKAKAYRQLYEDLHKRFEEAFWSESEGFYYDRLHPKPEIIPAPYDALPLFFELTSPERGRRVLEVIEKSDLITDCGVRIFRYTGRIKEGYYEGSVWPLYTWIVGLSALKYGVFDLGYKLLKSLVELAYKASDPGKINEYYEYDCSREKGQFIQGFSSAPVIHLLTEGILGLKPDAKTGVLVLEIRVPESWDKISLRNLRFRDHSLNFVIKRLSGSILKVEAENLSNKPLKIKFRVIQPGAGGKETSVIEEALDLRPCGSVGLKIKVG